MAQSNEIQMLLALEHCRKVNKPNFSAIVCQFPPVNRQTLKRRFEGTQNSRAQANSDSQQCLSIEQEKQLISHINMLTKRHLPPTSTIVQNLAEEIIGRAVEKKWTSQFICRHKDKLESLYLRNIDNMRTKAEYGPVFKQYFDLVSVFLLRIIDFNSVANF